MLLLTSSFPLWLDLMNNFKWFVFSIRSFFWKRIEVCLWDQLCVCVWGRASLLLNSWTKFYDIWYVYHGSWPHLSGIINKCPHISNTNTTATLISEAKPKYCLNVCTNLHEIWFVCHATRAHFKCALKKKSLPWIIPTLQPFNLMNIEHELQYVLATICCDTVKKNNHIWGKDNFF
jgi:hypothetical protein